ncbi:phosphatidate cytidylyltransferase [Deferrisoma sp.]
MSARVRTALWAGAGFLAVLVFGGPWGFGVLTAGVAALGAAEYFRMAVAEPDPLEHLGVALWAGAVVLGFLCPDSGVPGLLLAAGAAGYVLVRILGSGPSPDGLARWGAAVAAWVGVGYFLGHLVWIREVGVSAVVFLLAVVWAGDTAAYYVGSAIGEHRLAPAVSPKKSVEGAVASLAAAAILGAVVSLLLPVPHGMIRGAGIALAVNVAAQLGDLLESVWKRSAGVKDSGTLLPGHGGVLDRVDALLLAAPAYAGILKLLGAGP